MATHKSAAKRAKQNKKKNIRNIALFAKTRTLTKSALEAVKSAKTKDEAVKALVQVDKVLQKAASKGVIPKLRASRKVSRISQLINTRFA